MEELSSPAEIQIFYEKNPLYRSIYADGLIGGPTPANSIYLAFYATRAPIPKSMQHKISYDSTINPIGTPSPDSKSGILREIEIGIYMTDQNAREVYQFLKKIFDKDAN